MGFFLFKNNEFINLDLYIYIYINIYGYILGNLIGFLILEITIILWENITKVDKNV